MRLCEATLAKLPAHVARPAYELSAVDTGIVHIGPGVFHRSHLASYADAALPRCRSLAMCAVSLRTDTARRALEPQDFLYTLAVVEQEPSYQVIGAVRDILHCPDNAAAVIDRMADPRVHTVTLTITERGYHLDSAGTLDLEHVDIAADLRSPGCPRTATGLLVAALAERRAQGIDPFVVTSCDNLSDNGTLLGAALADFARELDAELASWIAAEVAFPCTVVDSITPSTDDSLRRSVSEALQLEDAWPVRREPFRQWVVEGGLLPYQQAWEDVGVTFSNDVGAYALAKLRILNGQHSALAYLGILAGHRSVFDAVSDTDLRAFLDVLSRTEIGPSLRVPPGFDLDQYSHDIVRRFENPAIEHQLEKIACDGSLKIPIRTVSVIRENLTSGKPVRCLCLVIAAWLNFLGTRKADGSDLDDPLAHELMDVFASFSENTAAGVRALLAIDKICDSELRGHAQFLAELEDACDLLKGVRGSEVAACVRHFLAGPAVS